MNVTNGDLPSFGFYFQKILSKGGDSRSIQNKMEKKLEKEKVQIAFQRFVSAHSGFVSNSPLLRDLALKVEYLQSSPLKPIPEEIQNLEDVIFDEKPLIDAWSPAHIQYLVSLYTTGLINGDKLSSLFSIQDSNGLTPLSYEANLQEVLSWLNTLSFNNPVLFVSILSIQDCNKGTPLHHHKMAWFLFSVIQHTHPDLVVQLFSIQDLGGNTPLHLHFKEALPVLQTLAITQPDLLSHPLSIYNINSMTPLQYADNFETAFPLLQTLAYKKPDLFVRLLFLPGKYGITLFQDPSSPTKQLLIDLARSQHSLVIEVLSRRDLDGLTPFDRLHFFYEALPLMIELQLNQSESVHSLFSGGYPNEEDLQSLSNFARKLTKSPESLEKRMPWLLSLAKEKKDLLIKALSLCSKQGDSQLDKPEHFKVIMPLLLELACIDPELLLKVIALQYPKLLNDVEIAIPLLQKMSNILSCDILNRILTPELLLDLRNITFWRPVPVDVVIHLINTLLSKPLKTEILNELDEMSLNYQEIERQRASEKTLSAPQNAPSIPELAHPPLNYQQFPENEASEDPPSNPKNNASAPNFFETCRELLKLNLSIRLNLLSLKQEEREQNTYSDKV